MEIAILGAGLSGLSLADKLSRDPNNSVTVIEQESQVGGMARSFLKNGIYCDLGSHRLHPGTPPEILDDIRNLIGSDLLHRPRNGMMCLQGKRVKFPLKPGNALMNLGPMFVSRLLADMVTTKWLSSSKNTNTGTFETILVKALGSTLCRSFYFPYARKLWGVPPSKLSATQAKRRVSSQGLGQIAGKTLRGFIPGIKSPDRYFYYPRQGSGQIADAYCQRAINNGVEILLNTKVTKAYRQGNRINGITLENPEGESHISPDWIFSTLPVTDVATMCEPPLDSAIVEAAASLIFRGMVLVYLELETGQFTLWDAHYFPDSDVPFSRMSEPKNYSETSEPVNRTILCVEVPCTVGGEIWNTSADELQLRISEALGKLGFPEYPVLHASLEKLPHAYPVYRLGYQECCETLMKQLNLWENFVTFGRQGLFWYANMHHVIDAGHRLSACFRSGKFDHQAWQNIRNRMEEITVAD